MESERRLSTMTSSKQNVNFRDLLPVVKHNLIPIEHILERMLQKTYADLVNLSET